MNGKKNTVYRCGICYQCGKEHFSNESEWIINAEHRNFCHSIKKSCFDLYLSSRKPKEAHREQYQW